MTKNNASRTSELSDRIESLDEKISAENERIFVRSAREIAPGVAGIILAEPEGLERALESIDPGFSSGAEIAWRLCEERSYTTNLLLHDDGSVIADEARAAEILELLHDPDDFPVALISDILPGIALEQVLDRIGWRPHATQSEDDSAHDQTAIDDERSGQQYGPIREYVISELPAVLSLMEMESTEPESDSLTRLLDERAALAQELKMESDVGFVLKFLEHFPAGESFVSGVIPGQEVIINVVDAQGNKLYSINDETEEPFLSCLADGSRPTGEPVALDPELFHPWTGELVRDGVRVSVSGILERQERGIVDELADRGLLSTPWLSQEPAWRVKAARHLAGDPGRWTEPDVSKFMSLADGDLERALLKGLCAAAGVKFQPTYRLMSGERFAGFVPSEREGTRAIDLVIADSRDDQVTWAPVVAIEIKFDAKVNGDEGYCHSPEHENVYSNQIICYPRGCVHHALRADKVPFLWVGPGNYGSVMNANAAINQRDLHRRPELFGVAFREQEDASKHWRVASWAEVMEPVMDELAPYGPRILKAVERAFTTESMPRVTRSESVVA